MSTKKSAVTVLAVCLLIAAHTGCGEVEESYDYMRELEEAGIAMPSRGSPQESAERAFEAWAQQQETPYRNPQYRVLQDDGEFATVRITAEFKEGPTEPWLEKASDVKCELVGERWQCDQEMSFQPTQAE
jgi:hypothetical protein